MEHIRQSISWFTREVFRSATRESNRGVFAVSASASFIFNLRLLDDSISPIWIKGIIGLCAIVFGAPLTSFMNDLYIEVIRPRIFKNKK